MRMCSNRMRPDSASCRTPSRKPWSIVEREIRNGVNGKRRASSSTLRMMPWPFPAVSTLRALLARHDPATIEMAVRFLEVDPWFFRSGYIKAELMRQLQRVAFTDELRRRLQRVILNRIQSNKTPREFRWYGRLARTVTDAGFQKEVAALVGFSSVRGMHARWILEQISS